jgi:hypothetical protein
VSVIQPSLNVPQAEFIALPHKFRSFVGGFGSGKTWVGCAAICKHAWEHPGINVGYFAPTYPHIRDIFYPTIEEVAEDWGFQTKISVSNKEVTLYRGKKDRLTILGRSMDKPEEIIGFKIGRAMIDELDVMKTDKARLAWRKIIARLRMKKDGLQNGVDVTTTPEGFKFVYEQFVKQVREKPELASLYGIVQSSTYDNEANLPNDYIDSLRQSYPPQLIEAYLRGQFVNLASGAVYPNFCRKLNHTPEQIQEKEALHIGMDFNVLNMTAIISVIRNDRPLTLAELTGVRDTPTMARMLKERYRDKGHAVTVYPDASGRNTSSKNASESDLTILREAGLVVRVENSNPSVKDRINSVNAMVLNDKGERRWLVNTDACPVTTAAVEQQPWDKNGEPDKTTGHDHPTDAVGYFISNRYPVNKRIAIASALRL